MARIIHLGKKVKWRMTLMKDGLLSNLNDTEIATDEETDR